MKGSNTLLAATGIRTIILNGPFFSGQVVIETLNAAVSVDSVPDCGHCVQPITLQPDCLSLDLIRSDVKISTVVPIVVTNPLIEPIVPAVYKNA